MRLYFGRPRATDILQSSHETASVLDALFGLLSVIELSQSSHKTAIAKAPGVAGVFAQFFDRDNDYRLHKVWHFTNLKVPNLMQSGILILIEEWSKDSS